MFNSMQPGDQSAGRTVTHALFIWVTTDAGSASWQKVIPLIWPYVAFVTFIMAFAVAVLNGMRRQLQREWYK